MTDRSAADRSADRSAADRSADRSAADRSADRSRVTVRIADERREGRAIDLRDRSVGAERVVAAVRRSESCDRDGAADSLRVECPAPGPVYGYVGRIGPETSVRTRTALAAAARSRGEETPVDPDLRAVRERLAELEVPPAPDLESARQRLAGTESAVTAGRERVAALRGRIEAARDAGRETADLEAELAEATRTLSERETERAAAREALDRARSTARESRDARDRRRRLEDRLANLERTARAALVDAVRGEFVAAVADVPGGLAADPDASAPADPFAVDDVTAALAVARVAALRAPVVLACDRFDAPSAAAWLDAPVIRV